MNDEKVKEGILYSAAVSAIIAVKSALRAIRKLRLEEAIALLFLIPSTAVTIVAYSYFASHGDVPRYIVGGLWRLLAVVGFIIIIHISARYKQHSKAILFVRETLPFGLALAVYTNLHDTIAFVNPGDISPYLIQIESAIFGVQPVLWAEKFYSPFLTEVFSFCYLNFFWYSFCFCLIMYFTDTRENFREVMVGLLLLFYVGYIGYIIFPASPPRLTLAPYFAKHLDGSLITSAMNKIVNISFATSRAAFPSLHCANTLMLMLYSFNYKKWFFFIFLPLGIGLILGTVYLRHHYVVDIIAGFALAVIVYILTPPVMSYWQSRRMGFR